MRVFYLKTISLLPLLPVKITMGFVKMVKLYIPRFGIVSWDNKTYFVLGGFGYYLGLKCSFIKITF